jgi:hypothetical protein
MWQYLSDVLVINPMILDTLHLEWALIRMVTWKFVVYIEIYILDIHDQGARYTLSTIVPILVFRAGDREALGQGRINTFWAWSW